MTSDPIVAELAVVIVNFNTGDYLERCLASLDTHRGDITTDVLVIDNASHDGSHLRATSAHPWARLIENPTNVYLSPAWNQGIGATDAPWILLLNPDTEWWEGTLADYVARGADAPSCRHRGAARPRLRRSDLSERTALPRHRRCGGPRVPGHADARQPVHPPLPPAGLGPHDATARSTG